MASCDAVAPVAPPAALSLLGTNPGGAFARFGLVGAEGGAVDEAARLLELAEREEVVLAVPPDAPDVATAAVVVILVLGTTAAVLDEAVFAALTLVFGSAASDITRLSTLTGAGAGAGAFGAADGGSAILCGGPLSALARPLSVLSELPWPFGTGRNGAATIRRGPALTVAPEAVPADTGTRAGPARELDEPPPALMDGTA